MDLKRYEVCKERKSVSIVFIFSFECNERISLFSILSSHLLMSENTGNNMVTFTRTTLRGTSVLFHRRDKLFVACNIIFVKLLMQIGEKSVYGDGEVYQLLLDDWAVKQFTKSMNISNVVMILL